MNKALLSLSLFFFCFNVNANDEVLFSVGNTEVRQSEFEYIYKKNNFNNKADYSKKSLEEYLDLYINFRLKVKEAIETGYMNQPNFKEEFANYESQLLNSYIDKEVLDKLLIQEYERSKKDVAISHIYFAFNNDTTKKYAELRAKEALQRITSKQITFEQAAEGYSQDNSSKNNKGFIGWLNSYNIKFPEIEEAIYAMNVNDISGIVQTDIGFHILKLNDTRTARPKLKVAVIKKFLPLDTSQYAQQLMKDSMWQMYNDLTKGASFAATVQQYSDDEKSKLNNGELDWFGINTYTPIFEEVAYNLKNKGSISEPFKTKYAWYIIKKLDETAIPTYDEAKPILKQKLLNTSLYEKSLSDFIYTKRAEYNYISNNKNIIFFKKYLNSLIGNYSFKYRDTFPNPLLFKLGNEEFDMNRVGKRIETIYYSVNKYGTNRVDALLNEVEKNIIMERFKSDIKHNNQEYKALIEEYRNGIMIFDLSEKNIWNKAAEDSLGLITYYNTHKSDFSYPATHLQRTISTSNKANAQNIYKVLLKYPNIATTSINDKLKLLNEKELVTENTLPYTGNEPFNISTLKPQKIENKYVITQKYQFQPKKEKAFEECRGYVVAAYQQQLEEEWIANLKKKYPVIIHQNVLQKMIKQ